MDDSPVVFTPGTTRVTHTFAAAGEQQTWATQCGHDYSDRVGFYLTG
jgi:hypothetical protein